MEMTDLKIYPLLHEARNDDAWDLMKDPRQWLKREVQLQAVVIYDTSGRPTHKNWVYRAPAGGPALIPDGTVVATSYWTFIDDPATGIFVVRSRTLKYVQNDDTETDPIQGVYDLYNPADLTEYQEHMRTLSVDERVWARKHILNDLKIVILGLLPYIFPSETHEEHVDRGGAFWKHMGPEFDEYVQTGAREIVTSIQNEDPNGDFSWIDSASGFPNETIRQYMIRRIAF